MIANILFISHNPKEKKDFSKEIKEEYRAFFADDMLSTIEQLKNQSIDFIILDEENELQSNLDIIQEIKELPWVADLPIFLVAASFNTNQLSDYRKAGIVDLIEKPINIEKLQLRIAPQLRIKEYKELLKNERELKESFIQSANTIIIVYDKNFNTILFNDQAEKITGYNKEEAINHNLMEQFYPDPNYRSSIINVLTTLIQSHNLTGKYESDLITKSGDRVTVSWKINIKRDSRGEANIIINFGKDISRQRMLESEIDKLAIDLKLKNMELETAAQALKENNEELIHLNQMKDDFLAIASHDLRTPLNSIIGYCDLLLQSKKEVLSERTERILNNIKKAGEIQLYLINDLLDIVKLESGRIEIYPERQLYYDLIEHSLSSVSGMASAKEINLEVNISEEDKHTILIVDTPKILQVINNLLTNAIKFTHKEGKISVQVSKKENLLLTEVSDNGIGIEEEDLSRIFDKFEKIHRTGTNEEPGTGLGLAICKNLVELHGGSIWVESKVNEGSKFSFTLPLNDKDN